MAQHINRVINSVSILKGLAILGIVLVHSSICIEGINPYLNQFTRIGQYGCQLFFLISGYLMMLSWDRIGEVPFKKKLVVFYKKRCCSIIPVYVTAVIFYQIISLFYEHNWDAPFFYEIHHEIYSIVLNILLLHGFDYYNFNSIVPGGWFIGTIFLFYILFPFLKSLIEKLERKKYKIVFLLPLLAFLLSFLVQYLIYTMEGTWIYSNRGSFVYYSILNQLPCMLLGMLIGVNIINERSKRMRLGVKFFLMLIFGIFSLFLFFYMRKEYYVYIAFPFTISISFYFLYYLIETIIRKPFIQRSLISKLISRFGDISFAVYFSNFIGGMFIPWLVVICLNSFKISYCPTTLYILLVPFIYLISYVLALPIQSYIDYSKRRIIK